jgi:DnaJ-class molecular chaperone
MGPHTELVFKGEGHHRVNQRASNLVVKFTQKPHNKFKRFGNDLILEH